VQSLQTKLKILMRKRQKVRELADLCNKILTYSLSLFVNYCLKLNRNLFSLHN